MLVSSENVNAVEQWCPHYHDALPLMLSSFPASNFENISSVMLLFFFKLILHGVASHLLKFAVFVRLLFFDDVRKVLRTVQSHFFA